MSEAVEARQQQFAQWRAWATWGCAAAFFFYQFVVRVSPSVFTDDLMLDLGITADDIGQLGSVYYFSYGGAQLFVGLILDRLGVRYPLALAALMIMAGCLMYSYSTSLNILLIARFISGVGSALGFLSCIKTASMWFQTERLGLMIGLSILIGMVGATSGSFPMAYLVSHVGWRDSMMVLGLVGALLCLATLILSQDRSKPVGHSLVAEVENLSILDSLKILLKNPQTYLYAIYGGLMYIPMAAFADQWGNKYLTLLYNVDSLEASHSASITYIGLAASGPLIAMIADHLRSYKKVMLTGSLVTLVGYIIAIYFPLPSFYMTYPLFFVIGFALGAQFFAFASICELNPLQVSATASGFQNMVNMIVGGLSVRMVGYLLDYISDGRLDNIISRYTIEDFHMALSTVPLSIFIACALMLFVREAYPPEEKS